MAPQRLAKAFCFVLLFLVRSKILKILRLHKNTQTFELITFARITFRFCWHKCFFLRRCLRSICVSKVLLANCHPGRGKLAYWLRKYCVQIGKLFCATIALELVIRPRFHFKSILCSIFNFRYTCLTFVPTVGLSVVR